MASEKLIASNKKARHDYFIEDTYEAGIVLHGTEVKSLRAGHCSIKESFVRVDNGEVIIYGMHINPYEKGNIFNKDPLRPKKLMLHKYEINKLIGKLNEKGLTLVPLQAAHQSAAHDHRFGHRRAQPRYGAPLVQSRVEPHRNRQGIPPPSRRDRKESTRTIVQHIP